MQAVEEVTQAEAQADTREAAEEAANAIVAERSAISRVSALNLRVAAAEAAVEEEEEEAEDGALSGATRKLGGLIFHYIPVNVRAGTHGLVFLYLTSYSCGGVGHLSRDCVQGSKCYNCSGVVSHFFGGVFGGCASERCVCVGPYQPGMPAAPEACLLYLRV
jgi:Zinc knuckle